MRIASRRSDRGVTSTRGDAPSWARWSDTLERRYTLGVEEEVMLLERSDWSLAQSSDEVLARLSDELSAHTSPETHAAVVELATGIHTDVVGVAGELDWLRNQFARELAAMGLTAAVCGHPSSDFAGRDRDLRRGALPRSGPLDAGAGSARADNGPACARRRPGARGRDPAAERARTQRAGSAGAVGQLPVLAGVR